MESRIALVTGGAKGIGKAIALALAAQGMDIVINYNGSAAAAEATAEEIRGLGRQVLVVQADISKEEDCKRMFKEIKDQMGTLSVLVNNAGITKDDIAVRMTEEEFDAVINTNLKGSFFCMKHAGKVMMKQRYGRIISISSIVGVKGNPGQINYCAAKAGIIGMTKSLARELAVRNVTVNAVAPGFIETDMTAALPEEAKEAMAKEIPLGRMGKPEDIANAVAFLASDQASYITGQVLLVDGGMGI